MLNSITLSSKQFYLWMIILWLSWKEKAVGRPGHSFPARCACILSLPWKYAEFAKNILKKIILWSANVYEMAARQRWYEIYNKILASNNLIPLNFFSFHLCQNCFILIAWFGNKCHKEKWGRRKLKINV